MNIPMNKITHEEKTRTCILESFAFYVKHEYEFHVLSDRIAFAIKIIKKYGSMYRNFSHTSSTGNTI